MLPAAERPVALAQVGEPWPRPAEPDLAQFEDGRFGLRFDPTPLLPGPATVSAVAASNGLDIPKMLKILREEHQVILSGGQGSLAGKIFRIGHLGLITEEDIKPVISALKAVLPQSGFKS